MAKKFYDYPRNFKTRQYSFERKVNGLRVVYEVKGKGEEEVLGFIEIDQMTEVVKEHSGFITVQFSSVQEEAKQYLRK